MPTPTVDPRLAAVAARLERIEGELGRLDDAIGLLEPPDPWLADQAAAIRGRVDACADHVACVAVELADGLVEQPPTGPTIAEGGQ